jgi:hypothetical protein
LERWEITIKKINRKKKVIIKKKEIINLENEIVIFEIAFEIVHG